MSSEQARALLAGAIDIHVHSYPDLMERSVNDISMARLARDAGMRGFLLKSHYAPTAERAQLTELMVPEIEVYGSLVLNHFVGGMNPQAVEALGRSGGRLVYMPTSDALNEVDALKSWDPQKPLPPYLAIKKDMQERNLLKPAIGVLDGNGKVSDMCRDVLAVAAQHDMAISTGHISAQEAMALVPAAFKAGVSRVVITHPESPFIAMTEDDQVVLVRQGAILERCFAHFEVDGVREKTMSTIRKTGTDSNIISSDLGAAYREDPVTGFANFLTLFLEDGFSDEQIRKMIVSNPAQLLGV